MGWSTQAASLDLGTDKHGFGFGGTGKKSHNRQFDAYGEVTRLLPAGGFGLAAAACLLRGRCRSSRVGRLLVIPLSARPSLTPCLPHSLPAACRSRTACTTPSAACWTAREAACPSPRMASL